MPGPLQRDEPRQPDTRSTSADEMLRSVYAELRRLARSRMAYERPSHTLSATALVHEAFVRIVEDRPSWDDRAQFFAAAAGAMRRVLIEHARRRGRQRHGGDRKRVSLELAGIATENDLDTLLDLDTAVARLGEADPRCAEIFRLRAYAGLTPEDIASVFGTSARTVRREWDFARAYLAGILDSPS